MLHCEITSNGKTDIIYEVLCAWMWNDLSNNFKYIYSSNVLLKIFRYLYF